MLKTLSERLVAANAALAPYAVPHEGSLGREYQEPPDDTRFEFQRDRDRIIHTQAFRRLKGKTQVFVTGQGDHYRTRLTHTMEVSQISRDIARTLSVNEDLAECIALAHDLGHPPFGHAGEESLNSWMHSFGELFEHNQQSHRIVTTLEERSNTCPGLNVNREVLEGLLKHSTPHDSPPGGTKSSPSLEAQLVNIADEIAYTGHDCDDGLKAALFSLQDIRTVALAAEADALRSKRGTSLRGALIQLLVADLYVESAHRLAGIRTLADVYAAQKPLIGFSPAMEARLSALRRFLWERMYMHPDIRLKSTEGREIVTALCMHLYKDPSEKVRELQKSSGGSLHEAVKDYVSGMTDRYAFMQAEELGIITPAHPLLAGPE